MVSSIMNAGDKIETSVLADSLFSKSFKDVAEQHFDVAGKDLARGAIDQAHEHIKRGGKALNQYILSPVESSYLTPEETAELNGLNAKYFQLEEGFIRQTSPLSEEDLKRIVYLENKAQGVLG